MADRSITNIKHDFYKRVKPILSVTTYNVLNTIKVNHLSVNTLFTVLQFISFSDYHSIPLTPHQPIHSSPGGIIML